jgi:transposase
MHALPNQRGAKSLVGALPLAKSGIVGRRVNKSRQSSRIVIADFCNKIGTKRRKTIPLLVGFWGFVCSMVRLPTPEDEDRRRLCRERKVLTMERVQHVNRIKGLLFSQGVSGYEPLRRDRRQRLDALQTGDGRPLPPHLKAQVRRELDRLELLLAQIKAVEAERDVLLAAEQTKAPVAPAMLLGVKGIGPEFAAVLWSEGLSRPFENRRQVAAYAGLAPTPWQSGSVDREQGISQSGNPRLRTTMVQLAWLWLRHQPDSALALWFHDRVKRNGGRLRKTTIVALARKLLVALWKYVTAGVVIEGAVMKTA